MVPLMSLWLPILLSVVMVFVASSIIHMACLTIAVRRAIPPVDVDRTAGLPLTAAKGPFIVPIVRGHG